jgi:hypothetical protein
MRQPMKPSRCGGNVRKAVKALIAAKLIVANEFLVLAYQRKTTA